uniref:Uncharacterized protein n=1 Tax=Glossina brevipalpis TaxID=37001 RepID=A0A1A9WZI3_9MUSC
MIFFRKLKLRKRMDAKAKNQDRIKAWKADLNEFQDVEELVMHGRCNCETLQDYVDDLEEWKEFRKFVLGNRLRIEGSQDDLREFQDTEESLSREGIEKYIQVYLDKTFNNHKKQRHQHKSIQIEKGFGHYKLKKLLGDLNTNELEMHLDVIKKKYPDSKLMWLKELATFMKNHLQGEDEGQSRRLISGYGYAAKYYDPKQLNNCKKTRNETCTYPYSLLSPAYKKLLIAFLASVGENNLDYFYHYTLLEDMCTNISNDKPALGLKLLLQLVGHNWPHICTSNLANVVLLRNSYQNQSYVCNSLLWAVSQCGYVNVNEGIRIWHNVMLPIINLEGNCDCTVMCLHYLSDILENLDAGQSLTLNHDEFFIAFNALMSLCLKARDIAPGTSYYYILNNGIVTLLHKFIATATKHSNIFLQLLHYLENGEYTPFVIFGCWLCLQLRTDECLEVWKVNLRTKVLATKELLLLFDAMKFCIEPLDNFLSEIEAISLTLPTNEQIELLAIIKFVVIVIL